MRTFPREGEETDQDLFRRLCRRIHEVQVQLGSDYAADTHLRDKLRSAVRGHRVSEFLGAPLPQTGRDMEERILGLLSNQRAESTAFYTDRRYPKPSKKN
jgi:hypothetical protein